jgi:hypothetical protein
MNANEYFKSGKLLLKSLSKLVFKHEVLDSLLHTIFPPCTVSQNKCKLKSTEDAIVNRNVDVLVFLDDFKIQQV